MTFFNKKSYHSSSPLFSPRLSAIHSATSVILLGWSSCVLLLISTLSEAHAHNQGSAENRPFFQAPFPCGQIWQARTYDGHSPDEDSIDLSEFDSNGTNTSNGQPVLASASGTVIKSENTGASGGWGVVIDHGNGWVTANSYHMQKDDPWPISIGKKVVQGEQLGRTGKTGATNVFHQHYTQLNHYHLGTSSKNAVRIKFNGKSVATHAGADPNTWNDGEDIMSENCSGNTFMGWNSAGERYHLIYKPGSGETKIIRMNQNGSISTTYEGTWAKGWTHFMPFYGWSGHPHAIIYNQTSGQAKFLQLELYGGGVTVIQSEQWSQGWTHFVPFSKGDGSRYFLVYDSVHGRAKINQISADSRSSHTVYNRTWITGRTEIVPYTQGPHRYLLLYTGGSGKVKIVRIDGSGNNIAISSVWTENWSTGYTTLVPIGSYLFGYKSETGFAKIMNFKQNGQGVRTLKSMNWSKSWTAFAPYHSDGQWHLLIYKIGTGQVKTLRVKPDGEGFDTIWNGSWTLGWT